MSLGTYTVEVEMKTIVGYLATCVYNTIKINTFICKM